VNWIQFRTQWAFYIKHSLRDLRRNGTRTLFALFCITTGVAAVVALRSLALMIADELTLNLAEINRGDMQIAATRELNPRFIERSVQNENVFSEAGVTALRDWAAEENVEIQFAASFNLLQMTPVVPEGDAKPITLIPILVDPATWPYYGAVFSSEPDVRPLSELFPADQNAIVMSRQTALRNDLPIGQQLTVSGGDKTLTITAFVDDATEGSAVLRNGPAGLFGFMYYPLDRAEDLELTPLPDRAYVEIPLGRDANEVERSLTQHFGRRVSRITLDELEEQNENTADLIGDLILVMGLSSVLIGGVGIINTMNVIVGRRTLEIAVLKTLGMKAWRVTLLFLVEAALMGIIGSLIGVVLGIALSYAVRNVGEEVLQSQLSWRPYPEAWFSGITLGLVITVAFGFLPTLNAGQVRPIGVLRPNEIKLPTAGLTRTLGALFVILLTFGLTLNIIVSGRVELPFSMMLGLGGFLFGLFGGVMLANEGILDPVDKQDQVVASRRGLWVFVGAVSVVTLIAMFAYGIVFGRLHPLLTYGLPALIGLALYAVLALMNNPSIGIQLARTARQLLLLGGAFVLGGLVAGGIYVTWAAVLGVLYPIARDRPSLLPATIISITIGLLAAVGFRFRGRGAAGLAGMALIGAAGLSVIGFGLGDLTAAAFDSLPFWDEVEEASAGIIVVEIITLALGGAFAIMLGLVWLLGRLPSMGIVDVKLALRNINARRPRTASTMLGLIAGIGALSLITLTTSGVTSMLETQLETDAGGNVVIFARDLPTGEAVKKRLESTVEGVNSFSQFNLYNGRIMAIDGEEPSIEGMDFGDAADGNRQEIGSSESQRGIGFMITSVDPTSGTIDYQMQEGRYLTPDDIGKPVMVMRQPAPGTFLDRMGIGMNSTVTMRFRPAPGTNGQLQFVTYTVIGVISRDSEQTATADTLQTPVGVLPEYIRPESIVTVADIQDEHVDDALRQFGQISNAFALEISFLVQLIQRLLDQLIAIPALVAALALVAGVAIIANTVALETQERRRQIGIMKAVGLKGYRVMGQLIFENVLIGLVSGLLGVSIGIIATLAIGVLGNAEEIENTLHLGPALRLIGIAVVVSVAATLMSAWSAARESPMEVLRYE
jgi:ABC-type antimicrobial peptide transport system permease subunit